MGSGYLSSAKAANADHRHLLLFCSKDEGYQAGSNSLMVLLVCSSALLTPGSRVCGIGISGPMIEFADIFQSQQLGHVNLMPVAAPTHPLALMAGTIPTETARDYTQLVLTDHSQLTAGQNFGVLAVRDWRLGDLGAKHALLRAGLGWGAMPEEMIREDLQNGRLVHLKLAHMISAQYTLHMIYRTDEAPGEAGRWLMQYLLEHAPGK